MDLLPHQEIADRPKRIRTAHIPALDGVRAIAVLMVICFHYSHAYYANSGSVLAKVVVWGQTGVDLFFVLSGFLITGILLDSRHSEHFLRNFYVRRILRIFPLYYATLLVFYVAGPLLRLYDWIPWRENFWYWFYLQNIPATFSPARLGPGPGHFWSLAVEEHFYMFWPFLVLKFSKPTLLKICWFAVGIALVTRILLQPWGSFYFTPARLDGLAIGAALAIYARTTAAGTLAPLVKWARRLLILSVPALLALQIALSGSHVQIIQITRSTMVGFVYGCFLVLAIEQKFGRFGSMVLGGKFLGSIGKYSYGMYVFHPFVISLLTSAGLPGGLVGLTGVIVATYVTAWLSWTLFEKRFLSLKRYFEYSPVRDRTTIQAQAVGNV